MLEGAINGIRVRFIDTPGLQASSSAVGYNTRVLSQIRKAHRKYKPDNVLYFDRMDQVSPSLSICYILLCSAHMLLSSIEYWVLSMYEYMLFAHRCGGIRATFLCCVRSVIRWAQQCGSTAFWS